ncbi:MAG: FAD-dependent oxidoreductase [Oscillospiraceae bacterium]|nr:FAD-dependent oxidoreductase [Oscillospiraceae bacterium]
MQVYDAIIIGAGPAGVTAAIYLRRANLTVALFTKDYGALAKAERIENYFGMIEPVSGTQLLDCGRAQAKALGAVFYEEEVFALDWQPEGFSVKLQSGESVTGKAALIATGMQRKTLKIPGLKEYEGRGVSYCAVCDAFFYRGKTVAVLGAGSYAAHELQELTATAAGAYILTNGEALSFTPPPGVKVLSGKLKAVLGGAKLSGVAFTDGSSVAIDGLFVALGSAGAADLAQKLGAETQGSAVKVDEKHETNLPGLYAAGDCTGGFAQVHFAAAEGTAAALAMIAYIRKT